eukprot:g3547.t1
MKKKHASELKKKTNQAEKRVIDAVPFISRAQAAIRGFVVRKMLLKNLAVLRENKITLKKSLQRRAMLKKLKEEKQKRLVRELRDAKNNVKALKQKHAAEILEKNLKEEKLVANMIEKHAMEMRRCLKAHKEKFKEYSFRKDAEVKKAEMLMDKTKEEHRAAISDALLQEEKRLAKASEIHAMEFEAMKKRFQAEVHALKKEHKTAIFEYKKKAETTRRISNKNFEVERKKHSAECERLKNDLEEALKNFQLCEKKMFEKREEAERKEAHFMSELEKSNALYDAMKDRHRSDLKSVVKKAEFDVENLKSEARCKQKALEDKHAAKLKELNTLQNAMKERHKGALKKIKVAIEKLKTEHKASLMENAKKVERDMHLRQIVAGAALQGAEFRLNGMKKQLKEKDCMIAKVQIQLGSTEFTLKQAKEELTFQKQQYAMNMKEMEKKLLEQAKQKLKREVERGESLLESMRKKHIAKIIKLGETEEVKFEEEREKHLMEMSNMKQKQRDEIARIDNETKIALALQEKQHYMEYNKLQSKLKGMENERNVILATIQKKHAEEIKRLKHEADMQRKKEAMEYNDMMENMRNADQNLMDEIRRHSSEKAMMREDHATEIMELKYQLEEKNGIIEKVRVEYESMFVALEQAKEKLINEKKIENERNVMLATIQKKHAEEIKRLKHEADMQRKKEAMEYNDMMENMRNADQNLMDEIRRHSSEKAMMREDHATEIMELKYQLEEKNGIIEKVRVEYESMFVALEQAKEKLINEKQMMGNMGNADQNLMDELRRHATEIMELKNQLEEKDDIIEEVRVQYESMYVALEQEKEKLNNEKQIYAINVKKMENKRKAVLAMIKKKRTEEISTIRKNHAEEILRLKNEAEEAKEKYATEAHEMKKNLRSTHQKLMNTIRRETSFSEEHAADIVRREKQLLEERDKHAKECEKLKIEIKKMENRVHATERKYNIANISDIASLRGDLKKLDMKKKDTEEVNALLTSILAEELEHLNEEDSKIEDDGKSNGTVTGNNVEFAIEFAKDATLIQSHIRRFLAKQRMKNAKKSSHEEKSWAYKFAKEKLQELYENDEIIDAILKQHKNFEIETAVKIVRAHHQDHELHDQLHRDFVDVSPQTKSAMNR